MKSFLLTTLFTFFVWCNIYAIHVSAPKKLCVVEDTEYTDRTVENILPFDEIMNCTEPQIVVAHIIGMWPYEYPLWVYLAEYKGQKFLIYPSERDEIFEKHGLSDYEEEPYKDPYEKCKTVDDFIKIILEYQKDENDIESEITNITTNDSIPYDTTGMGMHNKEIFELLSASSENDPTGIKLIYTPPETSLSKSGGDDDIMCDSSEKNDDKESVDNIGCEIELGKTYLFIVLPSKFYRRDLLSNLWSGPVSQSVIVRNSKYCFRALNLKRKKVLPIDRKLFEIK